MDTTKTVLISAIVAVLVAGGAIALSPKDGAGNPTVPTFGALAGPDIASPYLRWGGVATYAGSMALGQATTTVCAIQSPAATSTLQTAFVRFDVSSTTASVITVAKATTAFATSTQIGVNYSIPANAQAFINASTTNGIAGASEVFAPNTWLVVGMQGGVGTMSPTGSCGAKWVSS